MPPKGISTSMKISVESLLKFEREVKNALHYKYSNVGIEATKNLIKVIKRIALRYRSYENFRSRILLITNTKVRLEYK